MDLIAYLQAKADRCRALASGQDGAAAKTLLKIADDLDIDVATLRTRLLIAVRQTRARVAGRGGD